MKNNIKQNFGLTINPTDGQELSQDDKELVELIAAVMANREKFRVILEQTNPNTETLKDQITNEIEQHLKDQGVDSTTINGIKAKVASIQPQQYDKYLTLAQLTTYLKGYATIADLPIIPNMDSYVTEKDYVKLFNMVTALQASYKVFYDTEYTKNGAAIKSLVNAMKLVNTQLTTISTEVTKNIDSLTQAHADYNELLANNASQDELNEAVDNIQTQLNSLNTSMGSLRVQSNGIKAQLDNLGDTSWQRTFTIYTTGQMPSNAPNDSIEIDSVDTYVKLFQLTDNQKHKCYVDVTTKAGMVSAVTKKALPVINLSKDLNIKAWQTGWGPIRAVNDYFFPKDYTNIKSMPDYSLRVERGSDGKTYVWIKTNTIFIDTITIGEL